MNLSSLVTKGALIKGAGSLAALSGASVGGYYIYDSGLEKLKTGFSAVETACSKKFFSDLKFPEIEVETAETLSGDSFTIPDVPTEASGGGSTKGCMIMKKTNAKGGNWNFLLETSISNEKIGISVLFEVNSIVNDSNQNSRYQVYLLEKNEQWKIKSGLISLVGSDFKQITSPDKSVTLNYDAASETFSLTGSQYSGEWTEKNEGGDQKSLLDGVFDYLKNIKTLLYVYKDDDKKLYKKGGEGAGSITIDNAEIKKWFEPFENKKGEWKQT